MVDGKLIYLWQTNFKFEGKLYYELLNQYNVYFIMSAYNFVLGAQVCTEANMDVSKKDLSEEQRVELEVSIRLNQNIIMIISKFL